VHEDALSPEGLIARDGEVVDLPDVQFIPNCPDLRGSYLYTLTMDKVCTDCGTAVKLGPLCLSCSIKATWRKNHPDFTPPLCKTCSSEITGRSRTSQTYCSRKCMHADPEYAARVGASRRRRVVKTCRGCGVEFDVPVGTAHRYNYCTRGCSNNARSRGAACGRCGAAFRHSQTQTRRYCSETCRRPPIVIACEHCGDEFRVVPSAVARKRYCSVRCYRASNAETSIERRVRETLEHLRYAHRSQVQIGPWVVDFVVGDQVVVEADGSYWHSLRPDVDRRKTADITSRGYIVWRLPEGEINAPDFFSQFERRLIDHEVTHGEIARIAPGEAVASADENRVIPGQAQRTAISKVHPGQLLLDL